MYIGTPAKTNLTLDVGPCLTLFPIFHGNTTGLSLYPTIFLLHQPANFYNFFSPPAFGRATNPRAFPNGHVNVVEDIRYTIRLQ